MNFNKNIVLENNRVGLAALQLTHFEKLLPIAISQPNLLQYSPSPFGNANNLKKYIQIAVNAKASNPPFYGDRLLIK